MSCMRLAVKAAMRLDACLKSCLESSAILSILLLWSAQLAATSSSLSKATASFCLTSVISPSSLRRAARSARASLMSALALLICMSRRLRLGGANSSGSSGPQTSFAKLCCTSLIPCSSRSTRLCSLSMYSRLFWPHWSTAACTFLMLPVSSPMSCVTRSTLRPSRAHVDFWRSTASSACSILVRVVIRWSVSCSSSARLRSAKPSSRSLKVTTASLRSCSKSICWQTFSSLALWVRTSSASHCVSVCSFTLRMIVGLTTSRTNSRSLVSMSASLTSSSLLSCSTSLRSCSFLRA
mmetsp:Transcript_106171/g.317164  ORF Transcript_106171/g.317164 Transcript_106171/m.317164 type:complete len:295 (-) Transcript_106171:155-1039(-)